MFGRLAEPLWKRKLAAPYVHLVFGARQTGKSTLLRKVLPETAIWLDFSRPAERAEYLRNPDLLVQRCRALPKSRRHATVVVDEAQMGGHRVVETSAILGRRQTALFTQQGGRGGGFHHCPRRPAHSHRGEMDRAPHARRRATSADVSGRTPETRPARLRHLPLSRPAGAHRSGDRPAVVTSVNSPCQTEWKEKHRRT